MTHGSNGKRIWIVWETQRRSLEMARVLGCGLHVFDHSGWLRYPKCLTKTFWVCLRERPDILFVQNPSMILAAFARVLKSVFNFKLVVDRHSSFRIGKAYTTRYDTQPFFRLIDRSLNRFTVSGADMTIVTNGFLARVVKGLGGKAFVLPDRLPDVSSRGKTALMGRFNILLISSFGRDEPFDAVFEAMELLRDKDVYLYVTGNYKKLASSLRDKKNRNVIFTGFLSDGDFATILFSADAVMALTTSDHTMLCSCYEAVAAGKPLITSKKDVLVDYFKGACFVENSPEGIRGGIEEVVKNAPAYRKHIRGLATALGRSWGMRFRHLEACLKRL